MFEKIKFDRRRFLAYSSLSVLPGLATGASVQPDIDLNALGEEHKRIPGGSRENMLGSYGGWAAGLNGKGPGRSSFLNPAFYDVVSWKKQALSKVNDLLAAPVVSDLPQVKLLATYRYDGLSIQKLSWQLPYGPTTEAYYLTPLNATGKLPGIVALHDHGGNKYFGKEKIVNTGKNKHPMLVKHQKDYYSGRAWANELAKQGYAVLVHDTFLFESRKVLLADVPETIRMGISDVGPKQETSEIDAYNRWAAQHEHIVAKSLLSAGTTWPGVFLTDDRVALSILASRKEVDANRIGCCGLSGGGLRSVLLGGLDSRIKAAVCVGMMSTWDDLILHHSFTHTWMMFMPLIAREMEYSELFALQMPAPRMVLNNFEDGLFDLREMERADKLLKEAYKKAGVPQNYTCEFYPGIHKFDLSMQNAAFAWLDNWFNK